MDEPDRRTLLGLAAPIDYFRTTPTFAVTEGSYAWPGASIFGTGIRRAAEVRICYFAVGQ